MLLKARVSDTGLYNFTDPNNSTGQIYINVKPVKCPQSHFRCFNNYECLERSKICDGTPDCLDGSDESPPFCFGAECKLILSYLNFKK